MRRIALATICIAAGFCLAVPVMSPAAGASGQRPINARFAPGRLIVRFRPGTAPAERAAALGSVGATGSEGLTLPRLEQVDLGGVPVARSVAVLERRPEVLYAEPDYVNDFAAVPDDDYFASQWALRNTGLGIGNPPVFGTPGADIDAVTGWDRSVGSSDVVTAIADTGIYFAHPDLGPNMSFNPGETGGGKESNGLDDDGNGYVDDYRGYDFFEDDNDPSPADPPVGVDRHGTQVASVAGARGDNSIGLTGVSQQASLLALRIGDDSTGAPASLQTEAFTYAGRIGAKVVNLSAGGPGFSQARLDAIRSAPDTLFVFGAGNDGADNDDPATTFYPCAHNEPNVVCVAATDQNDLLRASSNFGVKTVDLAAPGANILTADIGTDAANSYRFSSGTSLASPIVAGAAAVYRSLYPQATAAETRRALLAGVERLPSLAGKVESGGRLNLDRLLAIPPDHSVRLVLKAHRRQRVGRLRVRVGCGDEACQVRLGGRVVARKLRGNVIVTSGAGKPGKKVFRLKPVSMKVAAGETRRRRIRLKGHRRSVRRLRRLLKNRRYRLGSRAIIEAGATDAADNRAQRRVRVRLRP